MINAGEIYDADLRAGRRPVIVLSREDLNRGNYALVVLCTSAHFSRRRALPNCVPFSAGQFGLRMDCVAQCENLLTIHLSQLDLAAGPLGTLDDISMRSVIKAIGYVMDSDCEPN
jgi:mRNA-degrading endonuclease toxin of MazEF toxin-antitoxin module